MRFLHNGRDDQCQRHPELAGHSPSIHSLAGAGTVTNSDLGTTETLTIGSNNGGATFSGVINDYGNNNPGVVNLVKTGPAPRS